MSDREHVEQEERREQLRRAARAAWTEYQATGRHVSAEEAGCWLARLEAGEVAPPPECQG